MTRYVLEFKAYGYYITISHPGPWRAEIDGQCQFYRTEEAALLGAIKWCKSNQLSDTP
jgi:hypothetical protein